MSRMTAYVTFLALFITALPATAVEVQIHETRFQGALLEPAPQGNRVLRQFEALLLTSEHGSFFAVLDDPREGCPWPETVGLLHTAKAPQPRLMFKYGEHQYNIPLPPLALRLPQNISEGAEWSSGHWSMTVQEVGSADGRPAWKIHARERRGRQQTLTVSAENGILHSATAEVFMGQGDRFELSIQRTTSRTLTGNVAENTLKLQSALLALQSQLGRRPDTQLTQLSARQVTDTDQQIQKLTALARQTPLQETVLRISRDLQSQQTRITQTASRRSQLVGTEAPRFTLNLVGNGTLSSSDMKGKTIVLHFWQYADKPLAEPYGQVGYLDFLYNQRKAGGVQVVGIATNPDLQQPDRSAAARRSARKLVEFMNLSYPVSFDNGSLLRKLGDPRDDGGELPLWVVISPDGRISHYHAGFYEIDRRAGLKELDDILSQQPASSAAPSE